VKQLVQKYVKDENGQELFNEIKDDTNDDDEIPMF
jgi:hypothetical protein